MKGRLACATVLVAIALIPAALYTGDILVFTLALLIPFAQGLREDSI